MEHYDLEKWIWTEKDFEHMGWHDATIYGLRLAENLELDIDYIFQWNLDEDGRYFTFWVAPSTLVFEKPTDMSFELNQTSDDRWFEIDDIEMEIVDGRRSWTIITQQGEITFKADSFKQFVRKRPSLQLGQTISLQERGGFSFDQFIGNKDEVESQEVQERRKRDLEARELLKEKSKLVEALEKLHEERNVGQIQLKEFVDKRDRLTADINDLVIQLRGTRYEGR